MWFILHSFVKYNNAITYGLSWSQSPWIPIWVLNRYVLDLFGMSSYPLRARSSWKEKRIFLMESERRVFKWIWNQDKHQIYPSIKWKDIFTYDENEKSLSSQPLLRNSKLYFSELLVMKDKRFILSWPILILTGILYLYSYVGNPLDKEFDSGLIAMLLALSNLIILFLFKKGNYFIKQIIGIILLWVFIGIYFLI